MPKPLLTKMRLIREKMRGPTGDLVSIDQMARLAGISGRSIRNYEAKDSRCASLGIRRVIAGLLGVKVERIFDQNGWAR